MKVLFVGEIVGGAGRKTVARFLPEIIKEHSIDVVLANAENISGGRGITEEKLREVQSVGIDYFTSGDHVFWERGTEDIIDSLPIIRPANYPDGVAGKGFHILDCGSKGQVLIMNLMGRSTFGGPSAYLDDPFRKADSILEELKDQKFTAKILDFHADGTSEKMALAFYLDGRIDIMVGSHTHVPTADPMVLPKGTMYITDTGMTGIIDSVLGVKKEIIIKLFLTAQNQRFEWESSGRRAFRSVLFDTDTKNIMRIDKLV